MTTREVTKLLKRHLRPVLLEWGFDEFTGRTARLIDGPITIAVQVKSVTQRYADVTGVPLGTFHADIALDHGHANGAGYLRPEVLDHAQMSLRAHLSRTAAMAACAVPNLRSAPAPDLWFASEVGAEAAVLDVVESFRTQGRQFLDEWLDVDRAYSNLLIAAPSQAKRTIGQPSLTLPGNLNSPSRIRYLAVLAALRGDVAAERAHLEQMLAKTREFLRDTSAGDPWVVERLAELDGEASPP